MNGYFLFHGVLVRLTCSILELSVCPRCWRGKVLGFQRETPDDVISDELDSSDSPRLDPEKTILEAPQVWSKSTLYLTAWIPPTHLLFQRMCLYLLYNVFSCKVIMFPVQNGSTTMFNCSPSSWLLANDSFMTHGAGTISPPTSSSCPLSCRWLKQVTLMQQWWWFHSAYRSE